MTFNPINVDRIMAKSLVETIVFPL